MDARHVINVDLAKVWKTAAGKGYLRTLAWGDHVAVEEITPEHVRIKTVRFTVQPDGSSKPEEASGFIKPPRGGGVRPAEVVLERAASRVLKVNVVDVQQGDGAVVETPGGAVMLLDGGDNQLFARYLAGRYRGTSAEHPQEIACIVVSHGDADHFVGLTKIQESETREFAPDKAWKRLFINPARVYHNGLVKRPEGVPEARSLGATAVIGGKTVITGLEEDLLAVADAEMNAPFRAWKRALLAYTERRARRGEGPIRFRRLERGSGDAFDFLAREGVGVEVLGPILAEGEGARGLRFLGKPPPGPRIGGPATGPGGRRFAGRSASHTINGHSIVLRLTYGGFRFLLAGDLNEEAEADLTAAQRRGELDLRAEVFKAPHHGAADFSPDFLAAVAPLISVVSSGDESARKEYIHPRATLLGALGKHARGVEPLIFVTELVAFFEAEGAVVPERHRMERGRAAIEGGQAVLDPRAKRPFFAFSRAAFGLVKLRTDGRRLLVYTDSAQVYLKEAYAYELDAAGEPVPARVRQA